MKTKYRIGIDAGSTTLKIVVLALDNAIVYKNYRRHKAIIATVLKEELQLILTRFPGVDFSICITGSAGIGISERTKIAFVQEVIAATYLVNRFHPEISTLIDIGGEDAKMVFFEKEKLPDIRMNGSCAGGTGAFIDQMADLMHISIEDLGNQALKYETIYPIASRCGVFAKTDVQNLISRNVSIPNIAISIFQTVALQCITSLAKGNKIAPKVLCIGGPLTFIPALQNCFKQLLNIQDSDFFIPENGAYYPALGSALQIDCNSENIDLELFIEKLTENKTEQKKDRLVKLFDSEQSYVNWQKTRKIKYLKKRTLEKQETIDCFLGIDSGSTTTKILVMDAEEHILFHFYAPNEGNPLKKVIEGLSKFYEEANQKNVSFSFIASAATGYGEDLIKSALGLDFGIVETMAHVSGAQYVDPEVSFVLDIGGQDMKSVFIKKGVISNIELNEACSSGCGSFLQNFASTMQLSLPEFAKLACLSENPCDLGSRCTVFMNSKVKQSLRENATLGDITAGLAYSVVKNCLFKVLKISNLNQLGDRIVVQGGTLNNNAVFRALELLSEKSVGSTDHPELMGALGAALYAQKKWKTNVFQTKFSGDQPLPDFNSIKTKELQCKSCTNKCSVVRFEFANGNVSYAGNKCEKVFYNKTSAPEKGFNAFDLKNEVLFKQENENISLNETKKRIGIPRVLNMFENYPFWHTLFTKIGFEVVLSPESTISLYQKGIGSVMSDNICFPAKLVHGHINELIKQKVDRIFYPIVTKDEKEFCTSNNSFNCPVVSGYPDVIKSAIDPEQQAVLFDNPVITFENDKALKDTCWIYFLSLNVPKKTFQLAFQKALKARDLSKKRLIVEQKKHFETLVQTGTLCFVVASRPYHADPLIHQKVGQILSDLGVHVFTDDVFRQENNKGFKNLNIVSQWSYPNRVVQAAMEVAKLPQNVQLVQLNSFGCGPDSFFIDEAIDILRQAEKNHTVLRIDEIASPGSIRLRMRSLVESLKASGLSKSQNLSPFKGYDVSYTENDKKKTILIPWFTDFLSPFIPAIGELMGYKIVNVPKTSKESAEIGLKYGHNEVCYPSTLVLGDLIKALQSGKYDLDDVVVAITQTGGQCRATNYLSQIKAGLTNAGLEHIPVIVVSTGEVFQNEQKAFKLPLLKLVNLLVYMILYGDSLQQMYQTVTVREKEKGSSKAIFDFYMEQGVCAIKVKDTKRVLQLLEQAIADFNNVAVHDKNYTKIGLIGEIYLKYNNYGQAYITEWLQEQNMEVMMPPIMDFFIQMFVNSSVNDQNRTERESVLERFLMPVAWRYLNKRMQKVENVMQNFKFYHPSESIFTKAEYASEILSLSNQFGEGWLIAAEIACYSRSGIDKVVCIQPFGCIANHVVAKGIEKRIKKFYPNMNLLFLDIDGGVAEVNLQNRLHFMIG